jgi:hypothetical protein
MSCRSVVALITTGLALAVVGQVAVALEKPKDKVTVFNVPTSGKIMDVIYSGEFDEWWVKCREGDNIVVYVYDRRSKSWGRVLFVPTGQQEAARKPGKLESGTKPEPIVPGAREQKEGTSDEPRKIVPEAKKQEETKAARPEKRKWWDPLTILKKGEELIRLPALEGKKETNPQDAPKSKPWSGDKNRLDIE